MSDSPSSVRARGAPTAANPTRPITPIYVAVLLVEAVVLAALWSFSRYFGA